MLSALLLAGCGLDKLPKRTSDLIGTGQVFALSGVEGRWAGGVHPTAPSCGPERHGLMQIGGEKFAFDPFESTTVIDGTAQGDVLTGVLTRLGGEHRSLSIRFDGHVQTDANGSERIDGVLSSGRCTWHVTLTRG